MDQKEYLVKLLDALRARVKSGDTSVEIQLRATAAKLAELEQQEQVAQPPPRFAMSFQRPRRRCCGR